VDVSSAILLEVKFFCLADPVILFHSAFEFFEVCIDTRDAKAECSDLMNAVLVLNYPGSLYR
jgi:hypothetical protein